MNSSQGHDIDADSIIGMIDNSRKSNTGAIINVSFSNVQKNAEILELLAYLTVMKMRKEP